jgi:hypothetical protein
MADNRPDPYVEWRRTLPRLPDPESVTMSPTSHLGPQFPGEAEGDSRIAGQENPVHRNPTEYYGTDGSDS